MCIEAIREPTIKLCSYQPIACIYPDGDCQKCPIPSAQVPEINEKEEALTNA